MSLCESCRGLEIWPGMLRSRYLCGKRFGDMPKAFGQFGKTCKDGYPNVKKCELYEAGVHYSRKSRNDKP